jgi:hypothetical protein
MRALLVAVAALVALAGCGGGSDKAKTVTVDENGKPVVPAQGKAPSPATAAIDGRPIASSNTSIDDQSARVDIMALERDGAVVNLTLRVSNLSELDNMQIAQTFDDGIQGEQGNAPFTLDGVYLVDGVGRKKYLVARDTAGDCLCDGNLSNTFVQARQAKGLSATLAAPPPGVRRVDVFVPHVGTFRGVPIS